MRDSGLFVFGPFGQVTLGAVVRSLQRPPAELRRPKSTLRPPQLASPSRGCPSTHSHLCPRASLTLLGSGPSPGSPASQSSSRTGSKSGRLGH